MPVPLLPSPVDRAAKILSETPVSFPLFQEANVSRIVDLCSGGGGPPRALTENLLRQGKNVTTVLTDLHPNLSAFSRAANDCSAVKFRAESVDATKCSDKGFRTLFASFHHFEEKMATAILSSAVESGDGIAIFEITERSLRGFLAILLGPPVLALLGLLFRRRDSWTLGQLIFYPLILFTLFIDGLTSCLRTYSAPEFRELVLKADPTGKYQWKIERQTILGILPLTAYVGTPRSTFEHRPWARPQPAAARHKSPERPLRGRRTGVKASE